jgi:hypothetical protein
MPLFEDMYEGMEIPRFQDMYNSMKKTLKIENKPLIIKTADRLDPTDVKMDTEMDVDGYYGEDGDYYNNTVIPGKTEQMPTGAQRADATGKGKYVLISPIAMRRLAGVYERGAAAYGANNWKKGMPMSRVLDSAIRHLFQYLGGDRKEDHLAQAMWNVAAAIHFEEKRPDLNDLEDYQI